MSSERGDTFQFTTDDDRIIDFYSTRPSFRVGDKVYLIKDNGSRDGPYYIASVPSADKYTLSLEDGTAVQDGEEVAAARLERAT